MCVNKRWITNRYTGHHFLVNCGKCEACQQEKANRRASRIRFESSGLNIALFVTLTYNRYSCPYINRKDLYEKVPSLSIHREFEVDRSLFGDVRYQRNILLGSVSNPDYSSLPYDSFVDLAHRRGHIGVMWYPDLQNFFKRLRVNLSRHFGFDQSFSYFGCSEIGPKTKRPHFHTLIFIPSIYEQIFRLAICESWPFADKDRLSRGIEVARDAASYVSSYVNRGSDFPQFFTNYFPPKHSYSHHFGISKECFSLSKVLEAYQQRDLSFNIQRVSKGVPVVLNLPIPKYVIHRYFPIFKGYSRLTKDRILDVISGAANQRRIQYDKVKGSVIDSSSFPINVVSSSVNSDLSDFESPIVSYRHQLIDYSSDDYCRLVVRLRNAYFRFCKDFPDCSPQEYARLHYGIWQCYKSNVLYRWMSDFSVDRLHQYDNLYEIYNGSVSPPDGVVLPEQTVIDPNLYPNNITKHCDLTELYYKKLKTRVINDIVLNSKNYG